MKPQKKEAVSVQEIMDNPVAGQRAQPVRREGILGWLSYIGYMCVVALVAVESSMLRRYAFTSFYENKYIVLGALGVGLLLSVLTIWKSRYSLSKRDRSLVSVQFVVFVIGTFLFFFLECGYRWKYSVGEVVYWGIYMLWVCLMEWYLRYFYCKAKDGYKYVWLKVVLSTVLPFVPQVWTL